MLNPGLYYNNPFFLNKLLFRPMAKDMPKEVKTKISKLKIIYFKITVKFKSVKVELTG